MFLGPAASLYVVGTGEGMLNYTGLKFLLWIISL